MLFDKEYKDMDVSLTFATEKDPVFNQEHWWSNNKSLMTTVIKYIILAGYAVGKNS
jgi:hypothetical protein